MANNEFINGFVSQYPYTDFHELNADYILKRLHEIEVKLSDFEALVHNEVASQIRPYVEKVDEVNRRITELDTRVTNQLNAFSANMSAEFARQNQNINYRFNQILIDLNTEINALEADYNLLFNQFKNEIREINTNFQRNITLSLSIMDARIDGIFDFVENELQKFLDELPESFYVNSPVTGLLVTVQDAINELYDSAVRLRAITCDEFEAIGLTAAEFDALDITAFDFDFYGLDVLPVIDTKHYMYSPFTGEWVTLQTVINELAAIHRAYSLTATELDALDKTVSEYDAYEYTAFRFDWYSQEIFG